MALNPQQSTAVSWLDAGSGSLNLIARAGCGKCLGKGTPVMMANGWIKPVEDVVVGDQLMGQDSQPRTVLSTSTGTGELFRITPVKGAPWVCNDVHVMTLVGSNHHSGEVIDLPLNNALLACFKSGSNRPDKEWKLFRTPVDFPYQEVSYDAYVVGVWLGGGTFSLPKFTLGYEKSPVMEYLKKAAESCGCIFKVSDAEKDNSWNVHYSVQDATGPGGQVHKFWRYLKDNAISGDQKRIPREYLENSKSVRQMMLAALLDTDGYQVSGGFDFVTKYEGLRDDVLFLARSLGFAAYSSEKQVQLEGWMEPRTYQRISIFGDSSQLPLLRHVPQERNQIKNVLRTGWTAESIGVGEYFGFTLDGDGRFLLGDFTVTHNTYTLVEMAKRVKGWAYLGAYNKAIADELAERVGTGTKTVVGTLHSAGFKLWRKIRPASEVQSRKVFYIAREMHPYEKQIRDAVVDAVSYAKQSGIGLVEGLGTGATSKDISDTWEAAKWTELFDYYDLWDGLPSTYSPDRFILDCNRLLRKSLSMCESSRAVIDYDDMIYAPLFYSTVRAGLYDWVFIDEAQDLSDARRYLAMSMLRKGGRLVAVGDPAQSIYGFSGARNGSMGLIQKAMLSTELPLSITYRCPRKVVELANQFVPDLTAHESAPEGTVTDINYTKLWDLVATTAVPGHTAILCRFTRPLLGTAQRLRSMGIACHVEGNGAKGLLSLATKWGEDIQIAELLLRVEEWRDHEATKWTNKKNEEKAEAVNERAAMINDVAAAFKDHAEPVSRLVRRIEDLFSGEGNRAGITLCSIHRSKGREWDQVIWLGGGEYQPAWFASQAWELEQEKNASYVAITRAKRELVRVTVRLKKRGSEELEWWEE